MRKKNFWHAYTDEEIAFVRQHVIGTTYGDLTKLLNAHFHLALTISQIKGLLARYHFCNGRDGRFPIGNAPHNKGLIGRHVSPATEFRPGNRPANYKPIGMERVNADGYVEVKIEDPNRWRAKHALIWEAVHGSIPGGHVVIFADGDKSNIALENLLLVSRGELLMMNRMGLICEYPNLTRAGQSLAALKIKIADITRGRTNETGTGSHI